MRRRRLNMPQCDLFIEYALRMTKGRIRLLSQARAVLLMTAVAAAYAAARDFPTTSFTA